MEINIGNYLRLDVVEMIMVCISTLLTVLFAKKFFWKHVVAYFERRKLGIQEQLESAKQNKEESIQLKEEYELKLVHAKQEALDIAEEAKAIASQNRAQLMEEAQLEVQRIKTKAHVDMEDEKAAMRKDVQNEISGIAFLVARKIVEKEVDESVHQQYIDDFIKQMELEHE